ncbi:hypothetical protein ACA135_05685 [Methanobrevibacter acididurans]|uniref:hypothetical protein n=1 Tax=Methanobrevibacter acididurans TaxID=120963 RepID=UPI0038FBEFFD
MKTKALLMSLLLVMLMTLFLLPVSFAMDINTNHISSDSTNLTVLENNLNTSENPILSKEQSTLNNSNFNSIENQNTNTILTGGNITVNYGAGENYTVRLTTNNGNHIAGQHLTLNLTRLSDGASKVYWETTDTNGIASLQINLAPGVYTVSGSFTGNLAFNYSSSNCFNNIIVAINSTLNQKSTVLVVKPFIKVYGAGEDFKTILIDADGNPVIGRHLSLTLTRLSDGASKVYWETTDNKGRVNLQINLFPGLYSINVSFNNDNKYIGSSQSTTILIKTYNYDPLKNNNVSYNVSELTKKLSLNMDNWHYDNINNIYYQLGLTYCADPDTKNYESLAIYVPGEYFNGVKNSHGTYTCKLNTTNEINNYNVKTAPIVMPIHTPEFIAQEIVTNYNSNEIIDYINSGFVYVLAGCRGGDNTCDYVGGAPWGVTDLKAAVSFLKFNKDCLPGNTESIFTFGFSGGGAQSALMGVSGDSSLYRPYLESIGACMVDKNGDKISNSICGAMCWCPISSWDYFDAAYEWNIGQYCTTGVRANNSWTSSLSKDLAKEFAFYINRLGLKDPNGNLLTLNESSNGIYTSGTYYDYLLSVIDDSFNNYLNDTQFEFTPYKTSKNYINSLNFNDEWIMYNSLTNTVKISSIEAFINHCKPVLNMVGVFDNFPRVSPVNNLFGCYGFDSLHFNKIMSDLLINNSLKYSTYPDYEGKYAIEYAQDLKVLDSFNNSVQSRVDMYNPLYYLCDFYKNSEDTKLAKYWRISSGINQVIASLSDDVNLYLALKQCSGVKSIIFQDVWNQDHVFAERNGNSVFNFINWVNNCLNN